MMKHDYLYRFAPMLLALLAIVAVAAYSPSMAWAQEEAAVETTVQETAAEPAVTDEETPAEEAEVTLTPDQSLGYALDNIVLFVCAVLVLFMQAGFAMVEVGFNSSKNTVNILFKNVMDLAVGVCLFFLIGYGIMYPGDNNWQGIVGFGQVGIAAEPTNADIAAAHEAGELKLSSQVDFLFQVAFAATAATIVSGAVAGRMRFEAYLIYSAILTGLVYPISGMWKWGGGWLAELGFIDFAGSAVVHAVGGFAGLAGAIVLGPRIGRFVGKKSIPMPGHNLAFAALGVFILWVGWYGFNPGSNLIFRDAGSAALTMKIAVNTTIAPAIGAVVAMLTAWILFKKPDLTMALNGALAGLVGITANCDLVNNGYAFLIGAVAGVLVVLGIVMLDKLKIDDPVGAFPVHGLCGIWGCLAIILWDPSTWYAQVVGTVTICAWAFSTMLVLFLVLKAMGILRVSAEEEQQGLDLSEHGMHAYPPGFINSESYGGFSPLKEEREPVTAG
jgi:ammonium transporter, Amt family